MILSTLGEIYKPVLVKEIIGPFLVIIISFIIYKMEKHISKKALLKNTRIPKRRARTFKMSIDNIFKYGLIVVDALIILEIFGISTKGILTSLGLASVVVGLALQDTLKDLLAGLAIIFENQYTIGDTVTINEFKGEVIALSIKTTKIKSYTGDILIIANHNINQVINHSLAKSLAIVNVQLSYEEDTEKIEKVLTKLCERLTKSLPNIKSEVSLLGITNFGESGLEYRITVETTAMKHYEIERIIRKEIKMELTKHNIEIPYNQLVIHNA